MRVSAIHVRALTEAVTVSGVSSQAFLERAGLAPGRLSDPYAWFEVQEFDALLELALELTGDEALGLHWAEHSPLMQYDVLPPLVAQARSLQSAIEAILRFQPILADKPEVEFETRGNHGRFVFTPLSASEQGLRMRREMIAVSMLRLLKVVGAASGALVQRVGFSHGRPSYASEYERLFEGRACFEQADTFMEFQHEGLDSPQAHRNEELHEFLTTQAERVLKRVVGQSTYAERLKRLVQRKLPEVMAMEDAARALGMSTRSLRRRLSEEGVSYSELVEHSKNRARLRPAATPAADPQRGRARNGFCAAEHLSESLQTLDGNQPGPLSRALDPRRRDLTPTRHGRAGLAGTASSWPPRQRRRAP
ncbi:MAG: AraC family transcriptional regulator ligand-binding domain-containing protein [Myxococcales bacterium]